MGKVSRAAHDRDRIEREIRKRVKMAADMISEEYWKRLFAIVLIVLHDKFAFDMEQTAEFNKNFNAYTAMLQSGELKLHDIVYTLKREYNIEIEVNTEV